jgi:ketosteroid isomerase-like protein
VRQVWRAEGSGPALALELSSIFTLREGKAILTEFFWDHADALKAMGLEE